MNTALPDTQASSADVSTSHETSSAPPAVGAETLDTSSATISAGELQRKLEAFESWKDETHGLTEEEDDNTCLVMNHQHLYHEQKNTRL